MKRFFRVVTWLILIVGLLWWWTRKQAGIQAEQAALRPTTTFTPATEPPVATTDVPLLAQINREYVRVSQSVIPSVVNVIASRPASAAIDLGDGSPFLLPIPPGDNDQKPSKPGNKKHRSPSLEKEPSLGSGVIISREGHIITNCHVVKDSDDITVYTHDNRRFKAKLIATDDLADVAVLKIEGDGFQPLAWGDSTRVQIGEQVFAIGNPFGLSESVSMGIVSAKGRNPSSLSSGPGSNAYEDFIQTTAAINPGNSGGALVNIQGELIGINTAIQSTSRGFQGVGFAIPSNLARFAFDGLLKNGKVTRGYLGVTIQEVTPEMLKFMKLPGEYGALVTAVEPKSPSGKAGLQPGDVIVGFESQKINDPAELRLSVSQTRIGREVKLAIVREGKSITVPVVVAELTPDVLKNAVSQEEVAPQKPVETLDNVLGGIRVEEVTEAIRGRFKISPQLSGVIVTGIEEGSVAETSGVRSGDFIEQIRVEGQYDSFHPADVKAFYSFGRKVKKNQSVLLLLRRGRTTTFIPLVSE